VKKIVLYALLAVLLSTTIGTKAFACITSNKLEFKQLKIGPNPYNPEKGRLYFFYNLSSCANVEMRVYNQIGKKIFTKKYVKNQSGGCSGNNPNNNSANDCTTGTSGTAGVTLHNLRQQEMSWDGINQKGSLVSRGTYFVIFIATSDKAKVIEKRNITVLR